MCTCLAGSLCSPANRPHYKSCPSVCVAVSLSDLFPVALNSKTERHTKNQIGVNIFQGQFLVQKVRVTVTQLLADSHHDVGIGLTFSYLCIPTTTKQKR